ncbi:hypothetical protein COCCADRAFT_32031 [Bipolaris zeicola 26-R-13]|uniref:Uncharacterized protein n=1 Tax=Cochliobolus carbonum (strain 26-R-13) TaxID=930089 RepID=W6Z5M6_COCC2|nr:uncharacterized protein COCCADRAFT_32031 [Bipolaris zeicola 26-R-13]EUC38986.1 hypothetical protein COCCADRAFT_32031 [Bipolaris zeicola 26-R-13]
MAVNARFWRANAVVPRIIDGVALGETPRRRHSGPCTQEQRPIREMQLRQQPCYVRTGFA